MKFYIILIAGFSLIHIPTFCAENIENNLGDKSAESAAMALIALRSSNGPAKRPASDMTASQELDSVTEPGKKQKNLSDRSCAECGKIFKYPSNLKAHMLTHQPRKSYDCDKCHRVFTSLNKLQSHQLTHSHTCIQCHKEFPGSAMLQKHIQIFHHSTSQQTHAYPSSIPFVPHAAPPASYAQQPVTPNQYQLTPPMPVHTVPVYVYPVAPTSTPNFVVHNYGSAPIYQNCPFSILPDFQNMSAPQIYGYVLQQQRRSQSIILSNPPAL